MLGGVGADAILASYVAADAPIRWTPLAEKLGALEIEKQNKIETVLELFDCDDLTATPACQIHEQAGVAMSFRL